MAGNISNYAELKILEHSIGKTTFTLPACWVAVYTADPTEADSGTEVTGGSYARQQILAAGWASATAGAITTAADITFPTATANWGTLTHVGVRDASTTGNLIWYGPLTASKVINTGDVFKILTGQLSLSLD